MDIPKLSRFGEEHGMNFNIHGLFPPAEKRFILNIGSFIGSIRRKSMESIKSSIECLHALGGGIYSFHAPYIRDYVREFEPVSEEPYDEDKVYDIFLRNCHEIVDFASDRGIRTAIENHTPCFNSDFFATQKHFDRIFRDINSKSFGMLLDLGHLHWSSNELNFSKEEFIDRFRDKCFQLHVHENDGTYDRHLNVQSCEVLKHFSKDELRRMAVTLEAFGQQPDEIKRGMDILGSAL